MNNRTLPTGNLLQHIKERFYDPRHEPKRYYQDRRMLLYAITWPASWLDQRALPIAPPRYEQLLLQRLDDIAKHGDPGRYSPCFPRYLLKAIQDWFAWHGEDLYDELKHIRNALPDLEAILRDAPIRKPPDIVTPLAQAHAVLATQIRRKKTPEPKQLNLF